MIELQAHYIQSCHYIDIVIERAIIMQCGWPICQNKLKNVSILY